jgi:methylase of polypeptide subunit release factors
MSIEILRQIIEDFSPEKFINFFRIKNSNFRPLEINLGIENEDFSLSKKIGEIQFKNNNIIFCTFKVLKELTERSSKKKQYEIGKKILKNENADAGIFIFYDNDKKFRFSLIYTEYFGTKRRFSHFKRFTYFVSKDQTNNTFLRQIGNGDFSSLEKIKEAFSVEPITKEFYKEIQTWFFTALDKIHFPDNKEETKPLHLIRLLSRLIFIWFIKQKGLIPDKIFDQEYLKEIVKDFNVSKNSCNYYNAILQNLFFATLNQPIKDRGWAFNKGYPENKSTYGIKQLYRYEDKFLISPEKVMEIFSEIPFINGGLFDCLDKEDENGKVIYIDGFSREEKRQAKIPDYLFFSEEIKTDLSKYQIKSNQKARGLINILKSYNFTIDEATPIDQEVALDPELLGKIFENLLAVYNPETATTARKATGSYYTPREIVEYMVHQSLLEYFKTKLPEIPEEKLDLLLSYSDEEIEIDEKQKEKIIEIISEIKIIDPACGSGAFPMGILNKLVYVLGKIDPQNEYWKKNQIRKLKEELKKLSEKDEKEIEEHFKELEETFNENLFYPDYARKLYLIENCIFGVDIQQIATQLSKLRFFISLIIDQKVDKNKENFGIIPLPNLDLKFITANSLIGLGIKKDIQLTLFKDEKIQKLFNDIKEQYHRYFRAKLRGDKKKIRDKIEQLEKNLIDSLKSTIKSEKKKELEQLISQAKKIQEEIEKIKLEPEQFQIIEQQKLFGGITQLRINLKQGRIQSKLKELKEINKKIEEIKKVISGDILNQVTQKILAFKPFDPNYSNPWFEPEWTFGLSDGFDIVIANPPYIQLQKAFDKEKKYADLYKNEGYETFDRMGDIYCLFYEKGMQLLKSNGILTYISSNKWMRAGYGKKLREFFIKYNPIKLIDLGPGIFESATVDTCIFIIQKSPNKNKLKALTLEKQDKNNIDEAFKEKSILLSNLTSEAWFIGTEAERKLKEKIEKIGKPLKDWNVKIYRGILTGLNEAFIITTEKRNEILANCKDEEERKRTEAIIKPILRGRDIKRYYYEWAGLWVIGTFPALNLNIDDYPAIKKYFLDNFDIRQLEQSGEKYPELGFDARKRTGNKWFETQDQIAYYPEFEKEKIVYSEIVREPQFYYDKNKFYIEATAFLMTGENIKYLCGLLNSKPVTYFFRKFYAGGGLGDEGYRYKKEFLEKLPIPYISENNKQLAKQIESLVDKILSLKNQNPKADTTEYEKQIDQLVYKLYNLTEDEIKIIENYGTR